nr:bifunctional metallophosphatase/5'-nucleotidase [Gammaproteobacteria bacterium]
MLRALLILFGLLAAGPAGAAERQFTLLHTNDWQSRLLGYGPNTEYSPETTGDDDTVGGVARLASLIDERRAAAGEQPVLLLDAGDFTMGTLFHTVTREYAGELRLLSRLGYDATTLGNHEFDFRPKGLAAMLDAAHRALGAQLLPVLSSNLRFDPDSAEDDALEAHQRAGRIRPYLVIERGGLRFGLFGLLGRDAAEVAPLARPVRFADPVESARKMVKRLREQERVDVVIALSHMGVSRQADGNWRGEDVELAEQVPGLDIVVGGHSHTALAEPLLVNGVPVLQAGSEIQYLGELRMAVADDGRMRMLDYRLHPIDDRIPGDPAISREVDALKQALDERMLAPLGYRFDLPLARVDRRLTRAYEDQVLANLVTDALRKAVDAELAFTGNGTIRDDLIRGRSGVQAVSDLFRIAPLGIGEYDEAPGYPLVKVYFTGREIKHILEVLLLAYQLRDSDSYFPRVSGLRFTYNPWRVPFDRVSRIEIGDEARGYQELDLAAPRLYSVAASSYVASFTWLIPELTKGLLDVVPKDAGGRPFAALREAVVDADPQRPGVQEYKEWQALLDHVRRLPDLDGDGLADIPTQGAAAEQRMIRHASLSPQELFRNAGYLQWGAAALLAVLLLGVLWLGWRLARGRVAKL